MEVKEVMGRFFKAAKVSVSIKPREFFISEEHYEISAGPDEDDNSRWYVLLQLNSKILTALLDDGMIGEKIKCDLKRAARECGCDWDRCEIQRSVCLHNRQIVEYFLTPKTHLRN